MASSYEFAANVIGGTMSRRIYHDPPDESNNEILKAFDFIECSQIFDLEFPTQKHVSDDHATFSLPFWMSRSSEDTKCNKPCSSSSRFKAISDGRNVLMELIQNSPESSYELSLRDIITDYQCVQGDEQHQVIIEGKSSIEKPEIKLQKTWKNSSRAQMKRNGSMDSGVFLLKMFIPVSFRFVKKQKTTKNFSQVIPRTSSYSFQKPVLEGIKRSKYRIIRLKIRLVETKNYLCCWKFPWRKKSNPRRKGNAMLGEEISI